MDISLNEEEFLPAHQNCDWKESSSSCITNDSFNENSLCNFRGSTLSSNKGANIIQVVISISSSIVCMKYC